MSPATRTTGASIEDADAYVPKILLAIDKGPWHRDGDTTLSARCVSDRSYAYLAVAQFASTLSRMAVRVK